MFACVYTVVDDKLPSDIEVLISETYDVSFVSVYNYTAAKGWFTI